MADEKPEDAGHEEQAHFWRLRPRKKDVDWTHSAEETAAGEESDADAVLLDDSFLKRTFKEVHFPASKELCLRFVDQEQDFVNGLDRTVNLHNLITHLDVQEFATRRQLILCIKDRLAKHVHHHDPHHHHGS